MTIKEIPRSYEYTCDKCGAKHNQENASGHYHNSTPPDWLSLKAYHCRFEDKQDIVPADILLCRVCKKPVITVLQEIVPPHLVPSPSGVM